MFTAPLNMYQLKQALDKPETEPIIKQHIDHLKYSKQNTNQEAKQTEGKARLHLVPPQIMFDITEVREYGTIKYKDPDNWRRVDVVNYMDALHRHLLAMQEFGIDSFDPESGIEHYKHVACNCAFLCALLKKEDED